MPRTGLSQEELKESALDAAERLIRRFGFDRTRLVDIAKEVGVSHPILYRIFPDKNALMDAVSERWLTRIDRELGAIVRKKSKAPAKLQAWFLTLHRLKGEKVSLDPELYRAFNFAAERTRPVVARHVAETRRQLLTIVAEGAASGEFAVRDAGQTADLLYTGMISFHHPKLVLDNLGTDREALLKRVLRALIKGIE